jgi:hypothetical protein
MRGITNNFEHLSENIYHVSTVETASQKTATTNKRKPTNITHVILRIDYKFFKKITWIINYNIKRKEQSGLEIL